MGNVRQEAAKPSIAEPHPEAFLQLLQRRAGRKADGLAKTLHLSIVRRLEFGSTVADHFWILDSDVRDSAKRPSLFRDDRRK
ncbi:MAG: hypothetical protein ACE5HE_03860 [Phycisphaerae bacterium]